MVLRILHIPQHFGWSVMIRAVGVPLIALGLFFAGWLFKHRDLPTFLVSTYETMRKAARGESRDLVTVRTEPLILQGPHRHVRHPIYFAVVVELLGWWFLLDYTLILLLAFFFFLWFTLVVVRFEESELRAIFGEDYTRYARKVPLIFPSLRPKWPATSNIDKDPP
jgi:protein-S-isoprenylcysteine O-methyltransferase Ste14